tara:strand:- start:443 stop:1675 length:1233 start_codon:yes stop_codon:yes gene_type:complete
MAFGDPEATGPSKGGIGHGDIGYGAGQVDPGLAAAAGSYGAGSGLGQSVGSASAGGAGGGDSSDMSIEAFREAIARAMVGHVDQDVRDTAQAEQDAIDAAVAARDRALEEAKAQQERQAMMDQIDAMQKETNFATPATQAVPTEFDPQNPYDIEDPDVIDNKGWTLDESQFNDETNTDPVSPDSNPVGPTRSFQEQAMDDAYFGGQITDPGDTRTVGAHPSKDPRIGMPMGVGRPAPTDQQENREPVDMYGRVTAIEDIEDPEHRAKAYEILGKLQKEAREARTPLGKALRGIVGFATNNTTIGMIGRAIKAGLAQLGFNVDPNIIGQAIRAAHEQTTQGPLGAGGTSVGARNDSFIKEFFNNLPASAYDEPWMKGLTERQIQYYLDRPEELKWVRNLWNQMNPMNPFII